MLLVNLHLTHLRDAAPLRTAQLDTVLRHPWLRGRCVARLLCGDFNATLGDPELGSLLDGSRGWDVCDAYAAGGGGLPRNTIDPRAALDGRAPERAASTSSSRSRQRRRASRLRRVGYRPGPAGRADRHLPERSLRRDDDASVRAVVRWEPTT